MQQILTDILVKDYSKWQTTECPQSLRILPPTEYKFTTSVNNAYDYDQRVK